MSTCKQCGLTVNTPKRKAGQHRLSRWHIYATIAKEFKKQGMSYSEIARRLGFSRAYIGQRFNHWGQEKKTVYNGSKTR